MAFSTKLIPLRKGVRTMRPRYEELKSLDGVSISRPPHMGEIAAARFLVKQIEQGRSDGELSPFLLWVANYGTPDEPPGPIIQPRDQSA